MCESPSADHGAGGPVRGGHAGGLGRQQTGWAGGGDRLRLRPPIWPLSGPCLAPIWPLSGPCLATAAVKQHCRPAAAGSGDPPRRPEEALYGVAIRCSGYFAGIFD